MDAINSLIRFPITYVADGESKLLDTFLVTPKEMMKNKKCYTTVDTETMYMVQILQKGILLAVALGQER